MSQNPSPRLIYAIILGGMTLWALFLALGAYLYNHNPWRGVVVLTCFALFAGFWMLMVRTLPPRK